MYIICEKKLQMHYNFLVYFVYQVTLICYIDYNLDWTNDH